MKRPQVFHSWEAVQILAHRSYAAPRLRHFVGKAMIEPQRIIQATTVGLEFLSAKPMPQLHHR